MRLITVLPLLFATVSLILTFLTLFAGSSPGFLESYALVTLNTSQIGTNIFNTSESSSSDNPITGFFHNVTDSIESSIEDTLNSYARDLGVHDFYSAHLLSFCEGYYTPASVPNVTLDQSDISENVTNCSSTRALYTFDPQQTLQRELNASGHSDISLDDLHWPDDINKGLNALKKAQKAVFVLYCLALCFIFLACCLAAFATIVDGGRLTACSGILIDTLAFLTIGIASAIATAIAVEATKVINKYGNGIGVSAYEGRKFMALTWVATALMFISSVTWCVYFVIGRKKGWSGRQRISSSKFG